jgi:hypothetical protein
MLSIITACCRQSGLSKLYNSIQFDKIDKWIIVYDTSKNRSYTKLYSEHPKIVELECNDKDSVSGNSQRNCGMKVVEDGFVYFLDDDNIIHPNFWKIVVDLDSHFFYTFDQLRFIKGNDHHILYGDVIKLSKIDTAQFIVHKNHVGDVEWQKDKYCADGYFICDILNNNKLQHKYINQVAAYYNYLTW